MGPTISPRVPRFRATRLASSARQLVVRAGRPLLFLTVVCLVPTSALLASPQAQIHFDLLSVWSLYKWYVIAAIATFLIQAFLIARLLINQAGRKQAEERFAKS